MSLAAIAVLVILAVIAFTVIGFVLKLVFWAVVAVAVIAAVGWFFGLRKAS